MMLNIGNEHTAFRCYTRDASQVNYILRKGRSEGSAEILKDELNFAVEKVFSHMLIYIMVGMPTTKWKNMLLIQIMFTTEGQLTKLLEKDSFLFQGPLNIFDSHFYSFITNIFYYKIRT